MGKQKGKRGGKRQKTAKEEEIHENPPESKELNEENIEEPTDQLEDEAEQIEKPSKRKRKETKKNKRAEEKQKDEDVDEDEPNAEEEETEIAEEDSSEDDQGEEAEESVGSFSDMGLGEELLQALQKLRLKTPTPIQAKAIPAALKGKDILARARTGSGKTAAYALPILQSLLQEHLSAKTNHTTDQAVPGIKVLVLVPTVELSRQTRDAISKFGQFLPSELSGANSIVQIHRGMPMVEQERKLALMPNILISTPALLIPHIRTGAIQLRKSIKALVLDEADLLMSFGYFDDLKIIFGEIGSSTQSFLMSATLSSEVKELRKLVLRNPAIIKTDSIEKASEDNLSQYSIECLFKDKYLILYALVKLKLIKPKAILFVNSIDKCYYLKLFLERFGILSAVLNSELPQNSRYNIVQQFGRGMFDYLIATDENTIVSNKTKNAKKKDEEYGVIRGVDFRGVSTVVNVDCPESEKDYVHRIGRTARGGAKGQSLTFVSSPAHLELLKNLPKCRPFKFNTKAIEGFRYRVEDVQRSITRNSVRDARLKELKLEILNSDRLKSHFEENPRDLQLLKHATTLQADKVEQHLKHIPDYLMPKKDQGVNFNSSSMDSEEKQAKKNKPRGLKKRRTNNPLKTFKYEGDDKKNST